MGFLTSPSSLFLIVVAILGLTCAEPVRLCVTSQIEETKCKTFTGIVCVLGTNAMDCVSKINNGEADITTLDGGNINLAGKCHNMKPIICESMIGMEACASYYAVAVANIESTRTLKNLRGAKSCHTGLNKTAGWYVPMSVLFENKNNQLGQASNFFIKSCVPGAVVGSNMCELCTPNCNRNSENSYYGYDGAARCLENTDADVAFVKHLTFLTNDNKADFKLLCKGGSTATIDQYLQCHLAKVPAHSIVARSDTTRERIVEIFNKLVETPTNVLFSKVNGKNIIFSKSTNLLRTTFKTYTDYLTMNYLNALPTLVC